MQQGSNVAQELGQTSGIKDEETKKKHRDPAKAHSPDMDAQVTLGGAQYFVEGDIAKIDADYYFVKKDETGEQIRLIVNADTNLNCAAMPESRTRRKISRASRKR